MEQFRFKKAANGQGGGGAPFKPKTLSGVPYDECISGIQKMIRRGKEKEALILARELCASGYPAAVARRLMIIAPEDIGLANPALVAQVYTLCMGYLALKKDARAGYDPEPLALIMSIMMLCRSPKNREADDAQNWINGAMSSKLVSAQQVIDANPICADKHIERGKARLRNLAVARGTTYSHEGCREFYEECVLLDNRVEINGDPWGQAVYAMYGADFEKFRQGYRPEPEAIAGGECKKLTPEQEASAEQTLFTDGPGNAPVQPEGVGAGESK